MTVITSMIHAYCVNAIQIVRLTSRDKWNEPTYSVEDVDAYVEWKNQLVRNIQGEQVVSVAQIYLVYDGVLNHDDQIRINGVDHSIITYVRQQDFSPEHLEIFIA